MKLNYLSIDIGGTNIKIAIIDRSGNIVSKRRFITPQNLELFLNLLEEQVAEVITGIRGIAISTPGKVDAKSGTIYFGGALPFLNGITLKKILQDKFNLPVAVINDGKAAALAELWLGNLKNIKNGAAITLGTGVGGGIIINGELMQGAHFQAGEFSFLLKPSAELSIEDMYGLSGSAVGLIQNISKALNLDNSIDGETVFKAINQKDSIAYPMFQDYCREIAFIIANIQAIIDLECIVIGGGISAQEIVAKEIHLQYNRLHGSLPILRETLTKPTILSCKFQNDANLLGALYQLFLEYDELSLIEI